MARPIKETSILCGEDAKRFEERMKNVQKETPTSVRDNELYLKAL